SVGEGSVELVPCAALPEAVQKAGGPVPLVVDHEVVSLPSASTLALVRDSWKQTTRWSKSVAVFADPVFEADDPRMGAAGSRSAQPAPAPEHDRATREPPTR